MYLNSIIKRVNSFFCFTDDAIQGLVETFENANEDPAIVGNELGSMSDDGFQRMDLGGFLRLLHIKTIKSSKGIDNLISDNHLLLIGKLGLQKAGNLFFFVKPF